MAYNKRGAEQGNFGGRQPLSRIWRDRRGSGQGYGHSWYKEQPVTGHMESVQEKLSVAWRGVGGRVEEAGRKE